MHLLHVYPNVKAPHLKRLSAAGVQPDAGKQLHQWFKDYDMDMEKLRELSKNAEDCGWERPNVRTLLHPPCSSVIMRGLLWRAPCRHILPALVDL